MSFSLSSTSKANRLGVDSRLIEISDLAITLTLIDFGHGPDSGLRTTERQAELFSQGKSKADGCIKRSKHQSGKALDFYAFVNGKASWNPEHLTLVACAFFQAASTLGYKIKWGGLWKSKNWEPANSISYGWDCPHIELVD